MGARRTGKSHLLADGLEALVYIVNLHFPDEERPNPEWEKRGRRPKVAGYFNQWTREVNAAVEKKKVADPGYVVGNPRDLDVHHAAIPPLTVRPWDQDTTTFLEEAKRHTEKSWPELWEHPVPMEPLRRMRDYLQSFWKARDVRSRDWHIHRARAFYQEHRVRQATRGQTDRIRNARSMDDLRDRYLDWDIQRERTLDEVPPPSEFEMGLFELQRRAEIPSLRPRQCETCVQKGGPVFFLSEKMGTRYCSGECSQASRRRSNLKTWHGNKAKYRPKGR